MHASSVQINRDKCLVVCTSVGAKNVSKKGYWKRLMHVLCVLPCPRLLLLPTACELPPGKPEQCLWSRKGRGWTVSRQTIAFGPSGLQLDKPSTETGESLWLSLPADTSKSSRSSLPNSSNHGSVESWQLFAQPKYAKKHPWLVLKPDGIYCHYCSAHQPRMQNSNTIFITSPFTGNLSDKLFQHKRWSQCTAFSELPWVSTVACNQHHSSWCSERSSSHYCQWVCLYWRTLLHVLLDETRNSTQNQLCWITVSVFYWAMLHYPCWIRQRISTTCPNRWWERWFLWLVWH